MSSDNNTLSQQTESLIALLDAENREINRLEDALVNVSSAREEAKQKLDKCKAYVDRIIAKLRKEYAKMPFKESDLRADEHYYTQRYVGAANDTLTKRQHEYENITLKLREKRKHYNEYKAELRSCQKQLKQQLLKPKQIMPTPLPSGTQAIKPCLTCQQNKTWFEKIAQELGIVVQGLNISDIRSQLADKIRLHYQWILNTDAILKKSSTPKLKQ